MYKSFELNHNQTVSLSISRTLMVDFFLAIKPIDIRLIVNGGFRHYN